MRKVSSQKALAPTRGAALGILGMLALGACSTMEALPQSDLAAGSASYDYVLSQKIGASETRQTLEARLGGRVVMFQPSAGFAILGFRKGDAALQNPEIAARLENNKVVFFGQRPSLRPLGKVTAWAGGVSAWTGGSVSAWTGGVSAWTGGLSAWTGGLSAWTGGVSAWTGGQYNPIPENTSTWQQIRLEQGQALATHLGTGVKVAVIDTGVDLNHSGFTGSLLTDEDWDFIDNDATAQEEGTDGQNGYGHGTNVAGIVLQVAPLAKILPLRVLGSDGSGDITQVVAAINYAVSKGVKVINLSLGTEDRSQAIEDALAYAASQGVYAVSSAGNDNLSAPTYPARDASNGATLSGAFGLSVGSVSGNKAKSSFSNYGTAAQPLEVVAPGENVYAPVPGERMGAWSGTSMAAPMVSGALALALGETLNVSGAGLSSAVKTSGDDIYAGGLNAAYLNVLGQGRLNVEQFISGVKQP